MRFAPIVIVLTGTASCLMAGSISVDTSASATATYGTFSENAGPFPWSDLGFTAGASISSGVLAVSTGGSTSYNLNTPITGSEVFTPGSTTLNLGYTPNWSGSFASLPAANGDLNSKFVYNIGPFNGSDTLFNVPLLAPPANGNLAPSLNAGSGPVSSLESGNGPGVGATLTLSAQAFCPFCVTVASASLGFNIGTRVDQSVMASPDVTYGDLVWYSKTQTYSPSDSFTFVTGSGGNIADTFTNPTGLGLVTGDTFYMNILPDIPLDMPVVNNSDVAVPASINASWSIFGSGGSHTWPLGDLFSLGTGNQSFDFNPDFFGDFFYSIPLEFTDTCAPLASCPKFQTPATGFDPIPVSTGIPADIPPSINITGGGGTPGGYGITNLGPLFPGDPSGSPICAPAGTPFAGDCINQVTVSPEPRAFILLGIGLPLLAGGIRRHRSED